MPSQIIEKARLLILRAELSFLLIALREPLGMQFEEFARLYPPWIRIALAEVLDLRTL